MPDVVTKGQPPHLPDRRERDKHRIVTLVEEGTYAPGVGPWGAVRQALGGRVDTATFRHLVDELLDDGMLIEVWCHPPDLRGVHHALIRPGCGERVTHPVARARGWEELIELEHWPPGSTVKGFADLIVSG